MRRVLAAAVPVALLLALAGAAAPAAADDDGYPISVDVVDDGSGTTTDPGAGSGGGSTGSSGSGWLSGSTGGSSTGGGAIDTGSDTPIPPATTTTTTGRTAIRSSLFGIDGLRLGYAFSIWPQSGSIDTRLVLHNGSSKDIEVTVRGRLTGPFGNDLGPRQTLRVALKAGTATEVAMRLGSVGQWGLVTAHIEAVPPKTLDGTAMKTVSRTQTVFVVPWLVCAGLILGGITGGALYLLVRANPRLPVAVPA